MRDYYNMDDKLVRHCIEANNHNNLTACYSLLIKKKRLIGEDLNEYELTEYSSEPDHDILDEIAIII